mmetsp:Transcript_4570/g.8894  ORF Transcript_4570/g.8894 Transcript_4570/m.8894 type:complete len:657 (-) Transcript_4570:292-2262(-)
MDFAEVDHARKVASSTKSNKRSRKRKSSSAGDDGPAVKVAKMSLDQDAKSGDLSSQRRTGRWTSEEVTFCDKLMEKFRLGELPLLDGIKMNEFLGSMLLSKQSRLTKKMKNAKLSSQTFSRKTGFIAKNEDARYFSELEESFFKAIQCPLERAEIKFHMQKEWREMFSNLCIKMGQPLDADTWLSSVEEMDRRNAVKKDAARLARRKLMMGVALSEDSMNLQRGVFIEQTEADRMAAQSMATASIAPDGISMSGDGDELLALLGDNFLDVGGPAPELSDVNSKSSMLHAAPFLAKVVAYLQRHNVPFEHIDAWVPSFVAGEGAAGEGSEQPCRLCFAGSATTEVQVPPTGGPPQELSAEERFNLQSFGDYSQKFSFDVGYGLPGRVYQSGVPTWEQSVHNAPAHHFERCGGAKQWDIKTVVGIPVPSPNVGRIVCVLYSCHDRAKDPEIVGKLRDEFTKLMPSPKWKLVVDVSPAPPTTTITPDQILGVESSTHTEIGVSSDAKTTMAAAATGTLKDSDSKESRIDEIVAILGEHMPSDPTSPLADHIPGFISLRLMLLRASRSDDEEELVDTILGSYSSYKLSGRGSADIAVMLAGDFSFLTQSTDFPSAAPSSISFFKAPPTDDFLYKHSPALTPIDPPSGGGSLADMVSIVSN